MHPHQGDILRHRERIYELADQPLDAYFKLIGARPEFQCNADGASVYSATWSIEDGWLFLVDISGFWHDGSPLTIHDLFPFAGQKVFAAWWSGVLKGFRSDASLLTRANPSRSPDILINVEYGRVHASSMVHRSASVRREMPTGAPSRPNPVVTLERSGRGAMLNV